MLGVRSEGKAVCIAPMAGVSLVGWVPASSNGTRIWEYSWDRCLDARLWSQTLPLEALPVNSRSQCSRGTDHHHGVPCSLQHGLGPFGQPLLQTKKRYWVEHSQCLPPHALSTLPRHPAHKHRQYLSPHAWSMLPRHLADSRHQSARP